MSSFVLFEVASETLALPVEEVEQVLRMAALAPLHGGAPGVEGLLDLHGEPVPVLSVRVRLGLPDRPPRPADHLLLARAAGRRVALRVDRVVDVAQGAGAGPAAGQGAVALPSGLVPVPSLARLAGDASPGAR